MASLNAGPEYYAAEERYRQAKTHEEKMAALEEMLRQCPKHKGSQGVLFEIRDKMARLRREKEVEAKKKANKKGGGEFIRKQGGAQIALIGFPNSGKTALFNALTGLNTPSTASPFETAIPTPGMMQYEKVQIQLIDTPSLTEADKSRLFAMARNADLVLVLIDPFMLEAQEKFFAANLPIFLKGANLLKLIPRKDYDINDKKTIDALKKKVYSALGVIRVFTKALREKVEMNKPVVLKKGSTVADAARQIHKEFAKNLDYARVWGSSRFSGQRVSSDYPLKDGDIVELHLKTT